MKRYIGILLMIAILLSGCSVAGERIKEPVTFYYVYENYQKDMEPVLATEVREAAGHRHDLAYLLALYSMGASKEGLTSPLPRNTHIVLESQTEELIELSLTDNADSMTDIDFTLACACIAKTCMELTDCQQINITCDERSITIRHDNLLLTTNTTQPSQEE